jgi:histidyl-tRNA synthetase
MSNKLQPVRGMKDLLPEDFKHQQEIIDISKKVGTRYGYESISTPIIEQTGVFTRTLGDNSDVVSKEMYSFDDRGGDSVTLRPEFTASIVRAFISNSLSHNLPLRYFSSGPLFRYDRPQAGRQRQFHQINFEYLGADGPLADAETIKLAMDIFDELGIGKDFQLDLNSLGSNDSRARYMEALREYFLKYKNDLSEDSLKRLDKNPLRILDSKDEKDQQIGKDAPLISEYYSDECRKFFDDLQNYLNILGVKYNLNPRLVRGLDYYCHTAFEFTTDKLGAQSAIGGGGRYDGLSKMMGGPDLPAIGFAAGIERIMLLRDKFKADMERPIIILPIGDENIEYSIKLADQLRSKDKFTLLQSKGKFSKRMDKANKQNAKYTIIIGSEEISSGKYKVKYMDEGVEKMLELKEVLEL